ncbi:S-layer domain protein [Desulfofarcimen acetoxidans DSM 771]|uniref:S-layer domain protein n=1 Tax=Desulfofarcimen acetoxidans (strain ATCC 49208 / DSM 771 / KCTC 5769 / VKM B-1644 / 5575) TaxID=485916 RepID=C8W5K1_DESAS|nr:S-layer homology domain-containing protein [Desulfofarcimen acetoxidans]ACV64001.1 S-layer domain protein [Desulfofarcimen acetoxidans DSM 771]
MKKMLQLYFSIACIGIIIGIVIATHGSMVAIGKNKTKTNEHNYDYYGHWAEKYIEEAMVMGVVNGYPDGSFKPDEPVTRAVFAVMLSKIINNIEKKENQVPLNKFNDYDDIPVWARIGLQKAIDYNFLYAYPDNTIRPMELLNQSDIYKIIPKEKIPKEIFKNSTDAVVTRAEACVIISTFRFSKLYTKIPVATSVSKEDASDRIVYIRVP